MGEIVDHAAEYAVVERLAAMLQSAKEDYKATEAYALFGAIVCWVMQRVRTPAHEAAPGDQNARTVRDVLNARQISQAPWSVPLTEDMSAFDFFRQIRDSFAHGDARRVRPINEGGVLRGYSFDLRGGGPVSTVALLRADLARLGNALANVYCEEMKREPHGAILEAQAHAIREEVPA